MKVYLSPQFRKKTGKLTKKNRQLEKKIAYVLHLLKKDHTNTSLGLHKLTSREFEEWSVSVEKNIRIIFVYIDNGIYVTDIGSHDEVY